MLYTTENDSSKTVVKHSCPIKFHCHFGDFEVSMETHKVNITTFFHTSLLPSPFPHVFLSPPCRTSPYDLPQRPCTAAASSFCLSLLFCSITPPCLTDDDHQTGVRKNQHQRAPGVIFSQDKSESWNGREMRFGVGDTNGELLGHIFMDEGNTTTCNLHY